MNLVVRWLKPARGVKLRRYARRISGTWLRNKQLVTPLGPFLAPPWQGEESLG